MKNKTTEKTSDIEIKNTYELWKFLKTEGGFDPKNYDEEMFRELKAAFSISSDNDFEIALKKSIKQEDFIVAFFQLLQPFPLMISDILSLFDKYGVKQSNKNFEIPFYSHQMKKTLNFNIQNFIEYKEIVEKVISVRKEYIDNLNKVTKKMWEIWKMYHNKENDIPEFSKWNDVYEKGINIPEFKPEWIPSSKNKNFDKLISEIFDVWHTVREILLSITHTRKEHKSNPNSPYYDILQNETDYWLRAMLDVILAMAKYYSTLDEEKQKQICDKINDILKMIDKKSYQEEISVKSMQEILKLPVWKHRYEVYSIWVFSQIIDALSILNIKIILDKDGKLSFSFSGSELASINNSNCSMKLWSELRTICIKPPVSKKRKQKIRPDYSIVKGPPEDVNSSILVVECKQYKKQNVRNFSEAVIDYANNRPKADIFLVNYGKMEKDSISFAIEEKLGKDIDNRISLFSELRPDKQEKNVFQKSVKKSIFKRICKKFAKPANFKLEWNEVPKDLDIHLFFYPKESKDVKILNYQEKQIPNADISKDITSGFGPESIQITHWEEGVYYLSVHNYSKDAALSGCKGKLTYFFEADQQENICICPEEGSGNWWNIIEMDTTSGNFKLINKIEDTEPRNFANSCV